MKERVSVFLDRYSIPIYTFGLGLFGVVCYVVLYLAACSGSSTQYWGMWLESLFHHVVFLVSSLAVLSVLIAFVQFLRSPNGE